MSSQPKPLLAADRVRLYLTLVPYLLEHKQVSLAEAADEFGVTPQEMRGMVEKLTVIGLPGESGYWQQPQEMFDINWDLLDHEDIIEITHDVALRRVPRFTAREAAALLAGLQMVAAVPAVSDSGLVAGLISKLSRGAADAPADVVIAPSAVDAVREVVARGVQNGVAVSFTYQAPDAAPTTRTVDPMQILITNGQWYLQGWCHMRRAMRTFHLDRVSEPTLTDIPITHAGDQVPEAFAGLEDEREVTVRVSERFAPLLSGFLPAETLEAVDGTVTAHLHLADPRGIKRLAARFGGAMEVVEPGLARIATREWAASGLDLYRHPDTED
ncbi:MULTISPECIES: YafY family protein [unclassified Microbacterium]|uniref:helix-turn-helix transcriptional regulator n=1 Tax=unclassified Microbacterium TaxID=2609290 RepID=UPI000EAA4C62|nr:MULTISPECIES: WYL domain-containing protein [unclassified Microbacterium]MBT2485882.1 WYL domain-containing protein [Microbacterium sp. ISL-108]RKN68637.1 WYL domain-containing transcriptional regulator [Microbacterium sp. CGR2]